MVRLLTMGVFYKVRPDPLKRIITISSTIASPQIVDAPKVCQDN